MKINLLKTLIASAALALTLQINAATLTVSPSAISNNYSGVITLNITGLTNTEKVTIQTFLDLNGNGSIDDDEPLVDVCKISDGGAMIISGVTNINVPFDSNSATGAITTTLNFLPATIVEDIVGNHIYKLVSPTGRFSPVTAVLTVTNAVLSQSISGVVYSNGVALPGAIVIAQDQQLNNPVGGVVADASGHYFLTLPPGRYTPIASSWNCYYNFNTAPSIVLTNGVAATNDLILTNGTATISGNVY
ncbi:MAG TPA: carboxypeptidase-like regulatory domain-containing protein, partial [Verrucomicrobiae bacterium]|nr:carboxypeptidase-like regulatory domain-containing protein [Verrucomicrobiae bacterium]